MREILFRAKRIDNSEWIEGLLCYNIHGHLCMQPIKEDNCCPILIASIGQFTGLYDKNNQRIFEGDAIKNEYGNLKIVEYYRGYYYPFVAFPEYTAWDEKECEVVGNAYDFIAASNKM